MSYFSQIGALTVQQFVTPAVGIAVAIVLVRGFARKNSPTIGQLLGRHHPLHSSTSCSPSPSSPGSSSSARGRCRPWPAPVEHPRRAERGHPDHPPGPDRLHGGHQAARAPTAAGSSTPTRPPPSRTRPGSPTGCRSSCCCAIPFALTYTFGKMVGSVRHGAALLAAMVIIFGVWVGFTSYAEHQQNPAVAAAGVALDGRQHRGQGGPLRRHHAPPCSGWPRPAPRPARPTPPTTRSPPSAAWACSPA